ncbi:hypothetical protein M8J77_001063 [Diaphorina citri]|nr:hypothetical protein M8J77_001063 [Diaphorina citri]
MVLKMFCYAGFLQEMPPERDAPEAPPDAKRIRLLEEKAEKMERYMTQILSVLSRKPAPVSSKQSEVTSEAGPSSLPTASCLLYPQTAPSQPAPAAVSPPQSAPAAAPPSRPAPAVLLPPLLVGATSGPASAPPAGPSQPSAAAYPYMIPPQGLLGHYPHIDPGYYGLYHGGYQGPPHRSHMGIPPRDTPPVPSEDDDEEESNSEDEAGISHPLFSLAPSTREREPSVPDPDPELASQGISCQKLGSPAWNRVRYSESQKALQAGGVFKPLSVPGEIPFPNSSTFENLSRQDSFLGTLSHGLLLQRNALSGAMNTLAEKFPEVREELGSIFSDDGELKQVSDNLLQYVCGKRAECFEARRRLVEPKDPQLARLVRAIPPSPSCLFEEAQLLWALLFKQFLLFANPQPTKPVLLLLDGHASHPKNLELIKMARDNNVVLLLWFPPHCTHRMQPLDVSLMGPLSTYYEQEA